MKSIFLQMQKQGIFHVKEWVDTKDDKHTPEAKY